MDKAVRDYIEAIPPEYRPLFDRIDRLVFDAFPAATVGISYKMPTYRVEKHRLFVGVWKHGVSIYGWPQGGADSFIARHPTLRTSKGTIQLRVDDGTAVTDDEIRDLVRSALGEQPTRQTSG
ncbi:MAG TPA: DUF1801 domain-containing protein [Acidimicrobiales bacterium]|jgi:uncharacterized protein YdhG (YjbR/CyaY superfamily)|nr:DUF1801 domain-containing protein [Acidimicrobiales bacterium]